MSRSPRLPAVLMGLALVASACVSAPSDAHVVRARFEDAGVLIRGNDVKVAGVPVGIVTAFDVVDGEAELTLEIDRETVPAIHRDAEVAVRPVSLLGERYLELDPGTPDAGVLAADEPIPSAQTRRAVELDEVLDALDDPVSVELAGLITALGDGVGGRGEELTSALDLAPDSLDSTAALARVLEAQNEQIAALVDQTGPIASALAESDGQALASMVDGANELLRSTAADTAALDGTLARLPDTLSTALDALGQLDAVSRAARPVLADLRPVTDDLTGISRDLRRFSGAARRAVDELPEVVDAGEPVVRDLAGAGDDVVSLSDGLGDLGPASEELVSHLEPNWNFVLEFIRNWARVTQRKDATSHYFRVLPMINSDSLGRGPATPGAPVVGPTEGEDPPPSDGEGQDDEGLVPGLGGVGDLLGGDGTTTGGTTDSTSGTGLEADEEQSLLDFVLGGGR